MDKIKIGSLVTNVVLLLIILILIRFVGCGHGQRTSYAEVSRTTDTVTRYIDRKDTLYKTIATYIPVPMKVLRGNRDTNNNTISGLSPSAVCSDTVLYSDSIYRVHEFKAVISDMITGNHIAHRSIQWANLTPLEVRTVTHTITVDKKQPMVKIYLGADLGLRYATPIAQGGLDVAPAASIILSDRYMIDAGYYILGGQITAGMKVKLSLGK